MIKKAFSTLSVMELSPEEISRLARKYSFDSVEIRLDPDGSFKGLAERDAGRFGELYRGIGIQSVNTGITVTCDDNVSESIRNAASLASAFGAQGIRVFADPGSGRDLALLSEKVRSLSLICESYGVDLLIETHGAVSSSRDISDLYKKTDGAFRVVWDVLHTLESGEDLSLSFENLSGIISHVHLKDAIRYGGGFLQTALGKGDISAREVIGMLEGSGFDGVVSLEWEGYWVPDLRNIYKTPDELFESYFAWIS